MDISSKSMIKTHKIIFMVLKQQQHMKDVVTIKCICCDTERWTIHAGWHLSRSDWHITHANSPNMDSCIHKKENRLGNLISLLLAYLCRLGELLQKCRLNTQYDSRRRNRIGKYKSWQKHHGRLELQQDYMATVKIKHHNNSLTQQWDTQRQTSLRQNKIFGQQWSVWQNKICCISVITTEKFVSCWLDWLLLETQEDYCAAYTQVLWAKILSSICCMFSRPAKQLHR